MTIRLYNWVMPMVLSTTGSRIRALRERPELDMSQDELARRLSVSNAFLSEIERDKKKPPLGMVIRLAKFLGTTTDYLLLLTDIPDVPTFSVAPETANGATYGISPEADEVARIIDAMSPDTRSFALHMARALAGYMAGQVDTTTPAGDETIQPGTGGKWYWRYSVGRVPEGTS
jgi:transcriptional regulator with XRE-family HTH domain